MPEIITKYPDIALKILKDANIQCGAGKPQQILTWCPKDRFCALPTGEICIYGVKEVPQMMQIHSFDLLFLPNFIVPLLALLVMALALGILIGNKLK